MHLGFIEGLAQNGFVEGENINGIQIRGLVSKVPDWLLKFSPKTQIVLVPVTFDTPGQQN